MWKVLGGSVTGKAHVREGKGCQDASGWCDRDGTLCLVVADGAGSRPRSGEGSKIAVEAILAWVRDTYQPEQPVSLHDAFHAARDAVQTAASTAGAHVDEFASTLAVIVLTSERIHFGQIGDSIAVVRSEEGLVRAVAPPDRSEYINETVFLTATHWEKELRLSELPIASTTALALSTDGLQFKILDDVAAGIPYAPFFEDAFSWAATAAAATDDILSFIDELDDQSGDDKTLIIAVRVESSTTTAAPLDGSQQR